MTIEEDKVHVRQPFVFRVRPDAYAFVAKGYAEQDGLLHDLDKASRAVASSSFHTREKLKDAAVLDPCRTFLDAYLVSTRPERRNGHGEEETLVALQELGLQVRFFREAKAQMGCAGRPLHPRLKEDMAHLLETYGSLIQPAALWGRFPCSFEEDRVTVGSGAPIHSRNLFRFYTTRLRKREEDEYTSYESEESAFSPPEECFLFAATIGPGIDKEVARLSDEGESYQALLLNGIGAGAADMVGVDLQLYMNHHHPSKAGEWRRFHVGYGDFRLEEQRRLFELIDPGRIRIRLSEACVMIPEKSVSGIMAMKKNQARKA